MTPRNQPANDGQAARWRGLAFNAAFYGWTIILLPAGVIASVISRNSLKKVGHLWFSGALHLLALIVGLRHQVRGREHVPDRPVILAVKHQSAWETLALSLIIDDPVFVLKRELTRIPVFGWLLTVIGMIAVDRSGGTAVMRSMVAQARERIAEGRSIIIFPEGTRTPPGMRRRYQAGVAALYGSLDIPVVPVALNSGLFWPRRSTRLKPGLITLEFLPAIPPGLSRQDFTAQLETAIEDATERLIEEGGNAGGHLDGPPNHRGHGSACG